MSLENDVTVLKKLIKKLIEDSNIFRAASPDELRDRQMRGRKVGSLPPVYDLTGATPRDENEYGNKAPERKFRKAIKLFAKQLANILGYEIEEAYANIAPIGGSGIILMWKPDSEYGIYLDFNVDRNADGSLGLEDQFMYRATHKSNKWTGFTNEFTDSNISPEEMAARAMKSVDWAERSNYARKPEAKALNRMRGSRQ